MTSVLDDALERLRHTGPEAADGAPNHLQLSAAPWQAAAWTPAFGSPAPIAAGPDDVPPAAASEIVAQSVDTRDPHAIKFAAACLQGYPLNPRPVYLGAALDWPTWLRVLRRRRSAGRVAAGIAGCWDPAAQPPSEDGEPTGSEGAPGGNARPGAVSRPVRRRRPVARRSRPRSHATCDDSRSRRPAWAGGTRWCRLWGRSWCGSSRGHRRWLASPPASWAGVGCASPRRSGPSRIATADAGGWGSRCAWSAPWPVAGPWPARRFPPAGSGSSASAWALASSFDWRQPRCLRPVGAPRAGAPCGWAPRSGRSAARPGSPSRGRVDGWTSGAVCVGTIGTWFGDPIVDSIVGLVIATAMLRIVWESGGAMFTRLLDGVEPAVLAEVKHAARHTPEVHEVTQVRVRWVGHRLHAERNIAVRPQLSVAQGQAIATAVRHQLFHHLPHLATAMIRVDPVEASGEEHHRMVEHVHGDLPAHAHL
jgi:Dimerisation domain of Zinc Transporter